MSEDKKKPFDPLSDAFDVESSIEPVASLPSTVDLLINPDPEAEIRRFRENVDADFSYARENIMATIEKTQMALDRAIDFAQAAQTARAYEVIGGLAKIAVENNHALMDLSKKSKELKALEMIVPDEKPQTVNNNLFVGNMEDLQKALKGVGIQTTSRDVPIKTIEPEKKND